MAERSRDWIRFGQKLNERAQAAEREVSGRDGLLLRGALLASAAAALEVADELLKAEQEAERRWNERNGP